MGLSYFQQHHQKLTLFTVYFALLLDNLLLTIVVPILPHYIRHIEENSTLSSDETNLTLLSSNDSNSRIVEFLKLSAEKFHRGIIPGPENDFQGESSQLGLLLSLKATVQLLANPVVAVVTARKGFSAPLIFGAFTFLLGTSLFAFGRSFIILATARGLQGITSACFAVAGLGLVASTFGNESERSTALGRVMGGGALGIVIGYPAGGFLYQMAGKTLPFLLILGLGCLLLVLEVIVLYCARGSEHPYESMDDPPFETPRDHRKFYLFVASGAIFLTTAVMALLEPCVPVWIMDTMQPERWELGVVFIPDSIGYLLTTHFMGGPAYRWGRWRVSLIAMLLLGISCTLIPLATSVGHLTLPHLGIGAGLGSVDAALVPLLATLAEHNQSTGSKSSYGGTFAIGQTAVSLAYCLGPLIGGILEEKIGFPKLIISVGVVNLLYSPLLITLALARDRLSNYNQLTERTNNNWESE